jgi:DNA polymerase V
MKIPPICLLHTSCNNAEQSLRVLQSRLACGFPSPADDYLENLPSLDALLIKHPSATYIARASGNSMIERGILDGSLLIIDRAIAAKNQATIVASIAGEMTIKILDLEHRLLRPANPEHASIALPDDLDFFCEGVVTFCITPQMHTAFAC